MDKGVVVKGWKRGMDNIHDAAELAYDQQGEVTLDALRDAVNVDILDTGMIRRRKGRTKLISGNCHSVWSEDGILLMVKDNNLVLVKPDYSTTTIKAGIGPRVVQYAQVNGEVYYSNGVVSGKVVNGVNVEWGVEIPKTAPTPSSVSGSLFPGRYQVACTYINIYGEEGGGSAARSINISDGSGISISTPAASSVETMKCRVYMTSQNGEVFYLVGETTPGSTITISSAPEYTIPMSTQFMTKMLPGDLIEYYRGRMYSAVGNILWYSQPYTYGLLNPLSNYIVYPSEITILKAVRDGMYLAADKTYFLSGSGGADFDQMDIFDEGAAKYSASNIPNAKDILWYSKRGIMLGSEGGQIVNLQDGRVRPDPVETGVTLYREQDSITQVLGVGKDAPYRSALAAADYWDAEIERRT